MGSTIRAAMPQSFGLSGPMQEEQGVWLCIDEATPPTFKRPATYRLRILNSKFLQPVGLLRHTYHLARAAGHANPYL